MRRTGLRSLTMIPLTVLFAFFSLATFVVGADPAAAATGSVSGTVRTDDGAPVPFAQVELPGSGLPVAFANSVGEYVIPSVPTGTVTLEARGTCLSNAGVTFALDGAEQVNFTLPTQHKRDAFGYSCREAAPILLPTLVSTGLSGDDVSVARPLPFSFPFYGAPTPEVDISSNGMVTFGAGSTSFANAPVPTAGAPNGAIYAFWDDLVVDSLASVQTGSDGVSPNRRFFVRWSNVAFSGFAERVTVDLVLRENGTFLVQYSGIGGTDRERGNSATMGIENESGTVGFTTSSNKAVLRNTMAVLYAPNEAPVADAGPDQTVSTNSPITLDALGSTDDQGTAGLTFSWVQTAGPAVTINSPRSAVTTTSGLPSGTSLTFLVRTRDAFGFTDTDTVIVQVAAPK